MVCPDIRRNDMKLKAYLAEEGLTMKEFAELLGVHEKYISVIANGRIMPGKRLKRDIESMTGDKVKLEENMKVKKQ